MSDMEVSIHLLTADPAASPSTTHVLLSRPTWRDLLVSHERHAAESQWFHGLLYGTRTPQGSRVALVTLQDEGLQKQWQKLDDVHEHCLVYLSEAYSLRTPLPTVMTTPILRTFVPHLAPDTPVLLLLGNEHPDVVCYSAQLFGILNHHPVHLEPLPFPDELTPDSLEVP